MNDHLSLLYRGATNPVSLSNNSMIGLPHVKMPLVGDFEIEASAAHKCAVLSVLERSFSSCSAQFCPILFSMLCQGARPVAPIN